MQVVALNDSADVVGIMTQADTSIRVPFLYTNNTVYDLSTISNVLRNGTPAGINAKGQIAISAGGTIYLVSPATLKTLAATPHEVAFTAPAVGSNTGAQSVQIALTGNNADSRQWTVTPSHSWIVVSRTAGTGNGSFGISLRIHR